MDVGALADGGWNALLGDLYFAVFGEERRVFKQDAFHFAATRAGIRDAQGGLRIQLPVLQRGKGEEPAPMFQLSAYWLYVAAGKDGFVSRPAFTDGPTMIYFTLAYLLEQSRVTQRDILTCANDRCCAFFVPLRRPHAGQKSFCSPRCGNLIAAREYREKKAEELRSREKERSRKRYEEKTHKQHPGARIPRRPRKSK